MYRGWAKEKADYMNRRVAECMTWPDQVGKPEEIPSNQNSVGKSTVGRNDLHHSSKVRES